MLQWVESESSCQVNRLVLYHFGNFKRGTVSKMDILEEIKKDVRKCEEFERIHYKSEEDTSHLSYSHYITSHGLPDKHLIR
jgi:hypothetical protein